jgi:ABC-type sugar transport system permease subunit
LPLALGLAILLNQRWLKGKNFLRLAFFSPNLLGQVFVAILFSVLFAPNYGLLNKVLHALFGTALDTKWLSEPALVMPAIVLTSLWLYVGFNMIYFLAALQAVDTELYEAADADGANAWQKFWAVTMPGIRPVAIFVLVTATIGSFQLFELPYIMLNNTAGPNNAGLTVVMYLYNNGFITGDLGYASAVGWTLAVGVLIVSLIQMRVTGAWKGANS